MQSTAVNTQKLFRKLVETLAYPGRLVATASEAEYPGILYPETMDVLLTLLDAEASFHVLGGDAETDAEIQIRTLSQAVPLGEADYIVVPYAERQKAAEAIIQAKKGTLLDPNQSATLLLEAAHLAENGDSIWEGPGIKGEIAISVPEMENWQTERAAAVADFPLGMDIFLVGQNQVITGLPRTTKVKGAGKWDM